MNRRNRTFVVVGLAVALASLASFGVYRAVQNIPVREVPIATRSTVVATQTVPVGMMLTADMVRVVDWPDATPVVDGFTNTEDVVGRGVVASLVENEPVTEVKLAPREVGAGLPPTIPLGMRAMSVKVNDVVSVAGFTVPGTRVDVVVTVRAGNDTVSRVVLNNVMVLAAGTNLDQQRAREGEPIPAAVITLLVTPQDAEKLTLASSEGSIMLALRNPLDIDSVETRGIRVSGLLAPPAPPPVVRRVASAPPRVVPPPPPPPPYRVESIKGMQRQEVTLD